MKRIKILLCSNRKDFAHNTKYLFEYFLDKEAYEIRYLLNNDQSIAKLQDKYGDFFIDNKNRSGRKFIKDADVWLLDSGMPTKNIFSMRNKIIINFWHGVPIKKIGINGYTGLNKLRIYLQLKIFSYFIFCYTATSQNIANIVAQSFVLPISKVKVLGQPRNDLIHIPVPKSKILELFPDIEIRSRLVLYAPTWRKSKYGTSFDDAVQFFPFKNFDYSSFNHYLKQNNVVFFLRAHALETVRIGKYSNIKILDNDLCPNINDIINVFDLLITDYSGIFVDYLLLDKPILLLPYDLDQYEKVKGLNFKFDTINPGPKITSYKHFIDQLLENLRYPNLYSNKRHKLKTFFFDTTQQCMPNIEKFILDHLKK